MKSIGIIAHIEKVVEEMFQVIKNKYLMSFPCVFFIEWNALHTFVLAQPGLQYEKRSIKKTKRVVYNGYMTDKYLLIISIL